MAIAKVIVKQGLDFPKNDEGKTHLKMAKSLSNQDGGIKSNLRKMAFIRGSMPC
ncbi:hypothetical protein [[Leptolyngbya] sp. PCC 7376]|uniref:hypothetical protein n=1 Tax=[Leptolyngbya] sp. PCC 7376 TaxID=111781 RepID=UPI00135B0037|nr:hypothetical protein [[Leptolyngbya] sp. PCC 7376]